MGGHLAPQRLPACSGAIVHSPLQAGVIAPCDHAALEPNSAAATSGRVRFDSPKAATRATRPHQAHTAFTVRSCLDPASILFRGHLTATYHYCTEHTTLRLCLHQAQFPARAPVRSSRGKRLVAAGALHHPRASQDPSSAKTRHPPTHQPTTGHCSKVLAVERKPATSSTHTPGGYLRIESSCI